MRAIDHRSTTEGAAKGAASGGSKWVANEASAISPRTERELRAAVRKGDVGARLELANLLARAGRVRAAEQEYRRAIEAGVHEALSNLAVLLWDAGRVEEAEEFLKRAISSGDVLAHRNYAILLEEVGRVAEAEAEFLVSIAQGDAVSNLLLAHLYEQRGDRKKAEQSYRRSVALGVFGSLNDYGTFLLDSGREESGVRMLKRAAASGESAAWLNLAANAFDRRRFRDAEDLIAHADGHDPDVVALRAELADVRGHLQRASRLYSKSIQLGGGIEVRLRYALSLLRSTRGAAAAKQIRAALELLSED